MKIGIIFFPFFLALTKDRKQKLLLKTCGCNKTFIDNIRYTGKSKFFSVTHTCHIQGIQTKMLPVKTLN